MTQENTTNRKEELLNALLTEYGVGSIDELKTLPVFKEALSKCETPGQALRALAQSVPKKENVNGWYLGHAEFWRKNEETGRPEKQAEGPRLVLPDGTTRTFTIGEKLDCNNLAPVSIGPMTYTKNLIKGVETKPQMTEETEATVNGHEESLPSFTLSNAIERGMAPHKQYGTAYGGTGDFHTFAVLTILPDNVSYFRANEEKGWPAQLKVRANDVDGNIVQFKLPIEDTVERFGLTAETATSQEVAAAIGMERVGVHGRLGLYHPRSYEDFVKQGCGDELQEIMETLHTTGCLTAYKQTKDGTSLRRLDLNKARRALNLGQSNQATLEGGTTDADQMFIPCGGFRIFDIMEDKEPNNWQFSILATDAGGVPWMDVIEHPWSNANGEGIANEGAFIVWLDQEGDFGSEDDDLFEELALEAGTETTANHTF